MYGIYWLPDPDFYPSRIQQQQKRRGEKVVVLPFLVVTKTGK
jgi:hypothetical protein